MHAHFFNIYAVSTCIYLRVCVHDEYVCHFLCLSLSWCLWLFQRSLARSWKGRCSLLKGIGSLSGNSISSRLPHCCAVNQLVSLTAQQQNLLLPTHPITSAATLLWSQILEGLMYAFDGESRCLSEWSWHLSEWVMAMLLYVFCQETFKAYIETVKRTYWLQALTLCTQWLPIFHLSETL